jgi:hypothetical protein
MRAHFYERAGAAANAHWQVQYRLAVLDFSRGDYAARHRRLEGIVSSNAKMPDWLKASALLNLAWTRDLAGRRADAVTLYKRIVDDYDDESAAGPARLGLLTPYQRTHQEEMKTPQSLKSSEDKAARIRDLGGSEPLRFFSL